jgi:hypothetical protein
MDNNKQSYGVGVQPNMAIKPYQLNYEQIAAASKPVPAKPTLIDTAIGSVYNAGNAVNKFVGGVWNSLLPSAPVQAAPPVTLPNLQKKPLTPATSQELEGVKMVSPAHKAPLLEINRQIDKQ